MHLAHIIPLGTPAGGQANAGQPPAASPKLVKAAHEFEGQMMKELLQPMMEGDALNGSDDGDQDDSSGLGLGSGSGSGGALADFASEALGQALSERGGFGIANQIIKEVARNGHHKVTNKVTRESHGDTVMRTLK
jgi:Rod binding domain-containing protein